jgi:hypothetical protein
MGFVVSLRRLLRGLPDDLVWRADLGHDAVIRLPAGRDAHEEVQPDDRRCYRLRLARLACRGMVFATLTKKCSPTITLLSAQAGPARLLWYGFRDARNSLRALRLPYAGRNDVDIFDARGKPRSPCCFTRLVHRGRAQGLW